MLHIFYFVFVTAHNFFATILDTRKGMLPTVARQCAACSNICFHGVKLTDIQKWLCIIFIENWNIKIISVYGGVKPFIQLIILKEV